jgi:hypothetical protein
LIRTHAITTPKPCQNRKVAATRDACDRRELRVILINVGLNRGFSITIIQVPEPFKNRIHLGENTPVNPLNSSSNQNLELELNRLRKELYVRDQLVRELSQELFRLVKGKQPMSHHPLPLNTQIPELLNLSKSSHQSVPPKHSHEEQLLMKDEEIRALKERNQLLEEQVKNRPQLNHSTAGGSISTFGRS